MVAMKLDGMLADRSAWTASRCSVDKAMGIIGTRSAVLILREAFYGTTRFDDFAHRVGITEAVASARLKDLTAAGIFERSPYREPGQRTRYEYLLTEMGNDLLPILVCMMQWGDKYLQPDDGPIAVVARDTKAPARAEVRSESGVALGPGDLSIRARIS